MPIFYRIPGADETFEIENEVAVDIKTKEKLIAGSDKDTSIDDIEIEFGGTSPITFRWNKTNGRFELKDAGGLKNLEINDLIVDGTLNTHTIPGGTDTIALISDIAGLTGTTADSFIIDSDDSEATFGGGVLFGGVGTDRRLFLVNSVDDLAGGAGTDFGVVHVYKDRILLEVKDSVNGNVGLTLNDGSFDVGLGGSDRFKVTPDGKASISDDGSNWGEFDPTGLTGSRTFILPDVSGTIALTSDILSSYVFQFSLNGSIATGTTIDGMRIISDKMEIVDIKIMSRLKGDDGTDITVDVNKGSSGNPPVTVFTTQANRPVIVDVDTDWKIKSSGTPDIVSLDVGDFLTVDIDTTRVNAEDLSVLVYCEKVS